MSFTLPALFFVLVATSASGSPQGVRQETEPPIEEPSEPQAEPPPFLPVSIDDALDRDLEASREELEERALDELQELLVAWTGFVKQRQAELERRVRGVDPLDNGPTGAELSVGRDELIEGLSLLAAMVSERGGDVTTARELITELRARELERAETIIVAHGDADKARQIPLEALKAYLRPLTASQLEAQLVAWMSILQSECLIVRNAELAALDSADLDNISAYNARAVIVRADRGRLIDRVNVVVDSLESKGGDVSEERAFVTSVVEMPKIARVTALLTTAKAWLISADGGLALLLSILKAAGILIASWLVSKIIGRVAGRAMRSIKKSSELLRGFVIIAVRRMTIAFGVLIALAYLGVNMGPLLAAIGAAGLVIGLALQGTLSNFASGLLIMTNRPFDVGDLVSTAGIEGYVRGMTLVSTRIETFDKRTIFIPNNMVWGDVLVNYTLSPTRRLDLVFGIGYGDDIEQAQEVLRELVKAHPKVLEEPEPVVRVHELGDSSVNFIVRPFVRNEDYWDVYWDLTEAVKKRFDRDGISIPFPQRDVHFIPVERADSSIPGELQPAPPPTRTSSSPSA
ncbi:MAG: mechanosensitive ion channel family protein [Planctomycetota bacterium]|nr:MAG: mechanosensitive ion channel family protein [Planctomycetota bacterium]